MYFITENVLENLSNLHLLPQKTLLHNNYQNGYNLITKRLMRTFKVPQCFI